MAAKNSATPAKKKDTSDRILAAAFKCISSEGSASVSLRDIAQEAGVALSQLNYYYNNREQLFSAVLKSMKQDYIASIEKGLCSRATLKEKASYLIQHNRELLQTNKRLYRAFLEFFGLALWSKSFQREMNGFLSDISAVIESQIHTPSRPSDDPAGMARLILGATFGIAMQYLMDPDREEILRGFDILLRAI